MTAPVSVIQKVSHIGICVSDIKASVRFYCEGLGFTQVMAWNIGNEVGPIMEIEGEIILDSVMIHRDGVSIELLGYDSPKVTGEKKRRSMTQLGFTHLSLLTEDIDKTAERLVAYGGTVHPHTRTVIEQGDFIYCTDPDGIRIELMRLNGGAVPTA